MIELIFLLILIGLTFLSAFFSASEISFFSLPATKVKTFTLSNDLPKRIIARLLSKPRDLLVTIYMVNTLVNIMLQNVSSSLFGVTSSWGLRVGVPLFITLILGETIPKYLAIHNNETIAKKVAPTISFLTKALGPIREFIVKITTPISNTLFFFLKNEEPISNDELQHVLHSSKETGVLHLEEVELIDGYLQLSTLPAKEVMRPREDVIFYDLSDPLSKLTYLLVDEECSRIPVCEGGLDHVKGVLNANTFFVHRHKMKSPKDIISLLDRPFFLPETMSARLMLKRFDESNELLALVVDEHRSVAGLLSREDLYEVVIGPIADRRDQKPLFTRDGKDVVIASGKLELSTFNDIFSSSLESKNHMVTLGGWLTEKFGDIPKSGQTLETEEFLFKILASEPHRIKRVYIRNKGRAKES